MLFNFFDYDKDGHLSGIDLLNLLDNLNKNSKIYKEVKIISEYYVYETMLSRPRSSSDFLNLERFKSYLYSEVLEKQ
jgi:hypothetical protein